MLDFAPVMRDGVVGSKNLKFSKLHFVHDHSEFYSISAETKQNTFYWDTVYFVTAWWSFAFTCYNCCTGRLHESTVVMFMWIGGAICSMDGCIQIGFQRSYDG